MNTEHIITKVSGSGSIFFICSAQPKMELQSHFVPKICPVCRTINPVEMGVVEPASTFEDIPYTR